MYNVLILCYSGGCEVHTNRMFSSEKEAKEFAMLFSMDDYSITLTKIG